MGGNPGAPQQEGAGQPPAGGRTPRLPEGVGPSLELALQLSNKDKKAKSRTLIEGALDLPTLGAAGMLCEGGWLAV